MSLFASRARVARAPRRRLSSSSRCGRETRSGASPHTTGSHLARRSGRSSEAAEWRAADGPVALPPFSRPGPPPTPRPPASSTSAKLPTASLRPMSPVAVCLDTQSRLGEVTTSARDRIQPSKFEDHVISPALRCMSEPLGLDKGRLVPSVSGSLETEQPTTNFRPAVTLGHVCRRLA